MFYILPKDQIKPKADWHAIDSPKNVQINLFCLLFCFSQQTKQIHSFVFWKNLRRANPAFGFIWPLLCFHVTKRRILTIIATRPDTHLFLSTLLLNVFFSILPLRMYTRPPVEIHRLYYFLCWWPIWFSASWKCVKITWFCSLEPRKDVVSGINGPLSNSFVFIFFAES